MANMRSARYCLLLLLPLLVSNATAFQSCPKWRSSVKKNNVQSVSQRHEALTPSLIHRLHQISSSSSDNENTRLFSFDSPSSIVFGKVWLLLVLWAFSPYAPGSLGSAEDAGMVNAIIANPASPGINELFYTAFNFFAVIPVILSCLILPQGSKNGIPAGPFLALTSALGYIALGPYLALRAPPVDSIEQKRGSVSWVTSNILENKAFNWLVVLFTLYLPVGANLFGAFAADPEALYRGFLDIISTSRVAGVSMVDITILYAVSIYLTPRDYLLRKPEASEGEARAIAAATAVVPFLGSALYCALRPKLPITLE